MVLHYHHQSNKRAEAEKLTKYMILKFAPLRSNLNKTATLNRHWRSKFSYKKLLKILHKAKIKSNRKQFANHRRRGVNSAGPKGGGEGGKGHMPPPPPPPPPRSHHKAYLAARKKLFFDLMTPKASCKKNGTSASCSF